MITVEGKGGIKATMIAHSVSTNGKEIATYELEYPRFVHSEFMTHRLFSRNAASSRAIPVSKCIDQVTVNPAMPIHWGKNQPGMKADEECDSMVYIHDFHTTREDAWRLAGDDMAGYADMLSLAGYHKQIVNRLLEPFQFIKVVCTATEFDNFFHLRNHKDAQPEIQELARVMLECNNKSTPELLQSGEWHAPYVTTARDQDTWERTYFIGEFRKNQKRITAEEALKVSASCCAQVSYRLLDDSLEKAIAIYDNLVTSTPVHASPFEHQASPMEYPQELDGENLSSYIGPSMDGATHTDLHGSNWSGNLKGWIQYRQLIPNNAYWGEVDHG